jgi:hypothetical protein
MKHTEISVDASGSKAKIATKVVLPVPITDELKKKIKELIGVEAEFVKIEEKKAEKKAEATTEKKEEKKTAEANETKAKEVAGANGKKVGKTNEKRAAEAEEKSITTPAQQNLNSQSDAKSMSL